MDRAVNRPIRVAVIGGGCAAMTAAFELTRPEHGGRFHVTVYQQGHRLGGKGASGRGRHARIEEHGLHVWMGFYENAFRLMRAAYDEAGRDPRTCPIATWRDAFFPSSHIGLASWSRDTDWTVWSTVFPPLPGEPGAPLGTSPYDDARNPFSVWGYVLRSLSVMRSLFVTAYGPLPHPTPLPRSPLQALVQQAQALSAVVLGAGDTVAGLVQNQLAMLEALAHASAPASFASIASDLLGAYARLLDRLRPTRLGDPHRQRAGEVLELVTAAIVGIVRDGLLRNPRGFDVLDDLDFVEWLRRNGASEHALASPFLRGLYSLMFAYEDGDVSRPRAAAGQALRGCLRMFFTYRGSFFWKMAAGMGDIVFSPLYEALRRRGVDFEFFHRLVDVRLDGDRDTTRHVAELEMLVQAETIGGRPYEPLQDVRGVPSWPSDPLWSQLVDGDEHERQQRDFENFWDQRHVRRKVLRVRDDFDFVVLGVAIGEIPHVCREIVETDPRWRAMCRNVRTVATQAVQVWTVDRMEDLGWQRGPVTMTAFADPFDTWSDMTHLIAVEDWPEASPPGALGYFCNVLAERDVVAAHPQDIDHQARVDAVVHANAERFVDRDLPRLWPRLRDESGATRWDAFVSDGDGERLASQYWTANVNPTDRYVQSVPGSPVHRISPLDRTYDNLTIAGDWTDCGLSVGCVEAAVMSGLLAAHALSGAPRLESIVGYDHP